MRIYAPEILFAVGLLSMPAAGAEAVRRENPPLPQFMPPAARAQVETAETKPAAEETRRAAEALSAKFSEDRAASNDDAAADPGWLGWQGMVMRRVTAVVKLHPGAGKAQRVMILG